MEGVKLSRPRGWDELVCWRKRKVIIEAGRQWSGMKSRACRARYGL